MVENCILFCVKEVSQGILLLVGAVIRLISFDICCHLKIDREI